MSLAADGHARLCGKHSGLLLMLLSLGLKVERSCAATLCRLKASDGCGRRAFLLVAGDRFMFAADREESLPTEAGEWPWTASIWRKHGPEESWCRSSPHRCEVPKSGQYAEHFEGHVVHVTICLFAQAV